MVSLIQATTAKENENMTKMITDINTCEQCPLFSSDMEYCCKHPEQEGHIIENYEIMQEWCPLEDDITPNPHTP